MRFDASIFGLIVADVLAEPMNLRNPPAPGGLVVTRSIRLAPGGNVCNVADAMAILGSRVAATGVVGADAFGDAVVQQMTAYGVDCAGVSRTADHQTSATVVAVEPGGERVFFHTPGANALLNADAFRSHFDRFAESTFVQIGYFGLLPNLTDDLPDLLAELRRAAPKTKLALDTVNPPARWDQLVPILGHLDLFCPSRSEAAALTGTSDPKEMIRVLRRHMTRGVIGIKLDADGCLIDDTDAQTFVPAYRIDCVDTTGAGDTWFGGLLSGLARAMPTTDAARLANRAAADCCTALGASAGVRNFRDTWERA
jgi:sugar/nucleoside kinase (ribokinase family)